MLLWQMNLTRRSTVVEVLFYVADRYDVEGRQALFKYKWPVLDDESQWMLNASLYVEVPPVIRVDYYSCKDWAEEFLHADLGQWGIVRRQGQEYPALLDTGFSKEVARRHY